MNWFFTWLENRVSSFPPEMPQKPPATTWGFIRFYTRPFYGLLAVGFVLSILLAIIEVRVFAYVGQLVDTLGKADRATFWEQNKWELLFYAGLAVLFQPFFSGLADSIENQGMRGNYAMRIRWLAHRYMLRQSMDFFHNEFAGRVSTKVMQAALGVRDVIMKLTQVIAWVAMFFISAVASFVANDWRLAIPLVVWLVLYGLTMRYFVPRMGKLSEKQADMRSIVTGRIVDTYTNMPTVKLFAHASREDDYAKEGMRWMLQSVYDSMRVATQMNVALNIINAFLLTGTAAMAVWLWHGNAITVGAIAFSVGLVYRMLGMAHWMLWEIASLFEDFGVVKDGVDTIAREHSVKDIPNAKNLVVSKGQIEFETLHFNYGKPVEQGREIIAGLNLVIQPGEKVGLVGRSGAGKSTIANLLLRFYDVGSGHHPHRRPEHRRGHAGKLARGNRRCHAGHLPAPPLGARQHPLWPPGFNRRRNRRSRDGKPTPKNSSPTWWTPTAGAASKPTSANAASNSPAASANAWPSQGCCSRTPPS